jgi:hypothetical protein
VDPRATRGESLKAALRLVLLGPRVQGYHAALRADVRVGRSGHGLTQFGGGSQGNADALDRASPNDLLTPAARTPSSSPALLLYCHGLTPASLRVYFPSTCLLPQPLPLSCPATKKARRKPRGEARSGPKSGLLGLASVFCPLVHFPARPPSHRGQRACPALHLRRRVHMHRPFWVQSRRESWARCALPGKRRQAGAQLSPFAPRSGPADLAAAPSRR